MRDSLGPWVKKREADRPYAAPRPTYKNMHSVRNQVNAWKADAHRRGQSEIVGKDEFSGFE